MPSEPVNILAHRPACVYGEGVEKQSKPYVLDEQVGYVLRRVTQRHLSIFSNAIPELTTTQFAVLARLSELGPLSQNHLGRVTSMDAATIKGVVGRLMAQGYVTTSADPVDRRRLTVALARDGAALYARVVNTALKVSDDTLGPLSPEERRIFLDLLNRLT